MPPRNRLPQRAAILSLPVVFRVGAHALRIRHEAEGRWTVSVDEGPASRPYPTQVEAWEAGVRLADEQDRRLPA
jgi:hypothetical protein